MTLIVEDGTGKADAESYVSVLFCDTYNAERGNTGWAALTTDQKEQNLRKATEYMDGYYSFSGYRTKTTQALEWPRYEAERNYTATDDFWESDEVPAPVERACAELAFMSITQDLSPNLTKSVTKEKLGPLEVSYDPNSIQYTRFRKVDLILKDTLANLGKGISAGLLRI